MMTAEQYMEQKNSFGLTYQMMYDYYLINNTNPTLAMGFDEFKVYIQAWMEENVDPIIPTHLKDIITTKLIHYYDAKFGVIKMFDKDGKLLGAYLNNPEHESETNN